MRGKRFNSLKQRRVIDFGSMGCHSMTTFRQKKPQTPHLTHLLVMTTLSMRIAIVHKGQR